MDTTPEYIEMCRKAEEIQKNIEPEIGDFYFDTEYDYRIVFIGESEKGEYKFQNINEEKHDSLWYYNFANKVIWLPRQDQLQDMIKVVGAPDPPKAWTLNSVFTTFLNVDSIYSPIEKSKMSMEQLWLAFVMWKKYKKKWTGSEWKAH